MNPDPPQKKKKTKQTTTTTTNKQKTNKQKTPLTRSGHFQLTTFGVNVSDRQTSVELITTFLKTFARKEK